MDMPQEYESLKVYKWVFRNSHQVVANLSC